MTTWVLSHLHGWDKSIPGSACVYPNWVHWNLLLHWTPTVFGKMVFHCATIYCYIGWQVWKVMRQVSYFGVEEGPSIHVIHRNRSVILPYEGNYIIIQLGEGRSLINYLFSCKAVGFSLCSIKHLYLEQHNWWSLFSDTRCTSSPLLVIPNPLCQWSLWNESNVTVL